MLLGCRGGCVAGGTVGAIFATGVTVLVTVLIIMFIRRRTRKVIAITNFKLHNYVTIHNYMCLLVQS